MTEQEESLATSDDERRQVTLARDSTVFYFFSDDFVVIQIFVNLNNVELQIFNESLLMEPKEEPVDEFILTSYDLEIEV